MKTALGLFSIIPVADHRALTRARAAASLRWLPLLGAVLGALAGLPLAATRAWAPHATLAGAVLTVAALAVLTRGLHLDGLADTADGLASRATAPTALGIMRRSDIGPFGVLAVVLVLLLDVAALSAVRPDAWRPVAALSVAAMTGRVAVLHAAHRRIPPARPTGFGAYVAGSVSTAQSALATAIVLGYGAVLGAALRAPAGSWVAAQVAALVIAAGVRWYATRRLAGITGDVFGAVVEVGTATALAGIAFS